VRQDWPLLGLAIVACLLVPRSTAAGDARQTLLHSLDPDRPAFVGEQVTESPGAGPRARAVQRQKVYRKGNILRIEFAGGQVVFDDGQKQRIYLPRPNIIEEEPSRFAPGRLQAQQRAIRSGRVTVEQVGEAEVAGRQAAIILVKNQKGPQRKVWIDTRTYVQLRLEETRPNGRTVSTYFTSIDYTEPPASKLTFSPPPGAQVVERGKGRPVPAQQAAVLARGWGGLLEPKFIPSGYRFRGYYRHAFNSRPALVTVYASQDGRRNLSMFQGPSLGMGGMTDRKPGNLRVLSARKGNADVTLVGPLSPDEMQKVMDSVAAQ
jgi:hypothetical protein